MLSNNKVNAHDFVKGVLFSRREAFGALNIASSQNCLKMLHHSASLKQLDRIVIFPELELQMSTSKRIT